MHLKEIFMGTSEEKAAQQTINRLDRLSRLRPAQQKEREKAGILTRRLMLRRVLLGGSVVASGAAISLLITLSQAEEESLRVRQPFKAPGFENWAAYFNQDLPITSVLSIADDLINAPEYEGFPQVGEFLRTAIIDYKNLGQFNPRLNSPLRVVLRPMRGAIAGFFINTRGVGVESKVVNKRNGQSFNVTLAEPRMHSAELDLEQTMAFGSNAVKALMIAKEISHLVHMDRLKELLFKEFNENFDLHLSSSLPTPDLILNNAFLRTRMDVEPPLSNNFYSANILLDWAGYWHITSALGRMLRQGVLTDADKRALISGGNIPALNLATQRGLIVEQKPGFYVWRSGVGPFSQDWQDVMRNTPNVPPMPNTKG